MSLETFAYASGDLPKPETNKENLRLYGHPLWPFVQRAAFPLLAKDIKFQTVIMDIRNKAQWHLDLNGGFMPILENTDGTMVFESAVIMSFASDLAAPGQGLPIWPHEA